MAYKSSTDRINKYTAKLIPSQVGADITALKDGMVDRFSAAVIRQFELRTLCQGVLSGTPVIGTEYAKYYDFAFEVDKALRQFIGGAALNGAAAALVAKYTALNLAPTALTAIRDDIFGIPAPAP